MENAGKAMASLVNNRLSGGFSTYITNKFMAVFLYLSKSERITAWRKQYETYLEEEKRRKERNDYILSKLAKMRDLSTVPQTSSVNRRTKNLEQTASINILPQRVVNVPMLQSNVNNDKNSLVQQIVNKFILIPKRMFNAVSDNMTPHEQILLEEKMLMTDKNIDWRKKYEILDQLKQSEKQIDDSCVNLGGANDYMDNLPVKDTLNSNVESKNQNENKIDTTINSNSEIVKENSIYDGIRSTATIYSFNQMRNTQENTNFTESIDKQQQKRQEENAITSQKQLPKDEDARDSLAYDGDTQLQNLDTERHITENNHHELRYNEDATFNEMGNVQFSDDINKRNPDDDLKYLQQKGEEQQEQAKDIRITQEGCSPGEEDVHARQINIHKEHDQKLREKPNAEQQKHSTFEEVEDKYINVRPSESENINQALEEEINLQEGFDPQVNSSFQDPFFDVPKNIEDNDVAAVTNAQDLRGNLAQENYESDQKHYQFNPETIEVSNFQTISADIGAPVTSTDLMGSNQELVYSDMHQGLVQQQEGEPIVDTAQQGENTNQYYYHPPEQSAEINDEEATVAYDPSYEEQYQGTFEYTEPVVYDQTKQQEDMQKEYEANIYAQQANYDDEVQIDASAYNTHLQHQVYQYDSQAGYEQPQENYTDEQIVQQNEGIYNPAPEQYYVDQHQQQSVNEVQGQTGSSN